MRNLLITGLICVAAAGAEGLCAGRGVNQFMKRLKQPRWAPPLLAWYLVGLAYYVACFVALYRVLGTGLQEAAARVALILLLVLMAGNAGWNWIFFRQKNLRLSFWFFVPYSLLAGALLWSLVQVDALAAGVFAVYVAYFPYALAWGYQVWKLNR